MSATRFYRVDIKNDYLNIEHGSFTGDVKTALAFIKDFCSKNKVTYESYGHGYGKLTINDKTSHDVNPYGIDLEMMIRWSGKDSAAFPAVTSSTSSTVDNLNAGNNNQTSYLANSLVAGLGLQASTTPTNTTNNNNQQTKPTLK